jgi:nitroimidazol reductase NimA-like FMN-containing flavoprotein (pyridoxamine 5'-phosphate oxidase superfamily)
MQVSAMSEQECGELLQRVFIGRLGCSLDNQPYVVPVGFAYEPGYVYVFSTLGKKIEWMRENPKVCLQADEIGTSSNWVSVIVTGTYLELREPQYTIERQHARKLLAKHNNWWINAVTERREETNDIAIKGLFFRIDIETISGLRATG